MGFRAEGLRAKDLSSSTADKDPRLRVGRVRVSWLRLLSYCRVSSGWLATLLSFGFPNEDVLRFAA